MQGPPPAAAAGPIRVTRGRLDPSDHMVLRYAAIWCCDMVLPCGDGERAVQRCTMRCGHEARRHSAAERGCFGGQGCSGARLFWWAGMLVVSAWLLFYTCLLVPVQICMWNYADACIRHAMII